VNQRSYWLELCSPAEFRPAAFPIEGVTLAQLRGSDWARARALWAEVGRGFWSERAEWTPARWQSHLDDPNTWFGAALLGPDEIGFFELTRAGDELKLEGFGLLPAWRGRGLGAGLLSEATRQAFALGARRIWLHTATDDHPHALPNYRARGYRVYREEPLAHPLRDEADA
jgi:ribosomal protein S18 acetylase RimI-like enzyme